jgi:Ser-tRNA(Ala) deacylase AlaX
MREFDAQVVRIDGSVAELDRTCFFASSGGQPCDTGEIDGLKVIDVRRGANGALLHTLEREPSFKTGYEVRGSIDWERRYKIMRLHSACHVMSGVLLKSYNVRRHTGRARSSGHFYSS